MNRQEIFDRVAAGLLAQGKQCVQLDERKTFSPVYRLRYRGSDGCKCAAGFLIPDILYKKEMEGRLFSDPIFNEVKAQCGISHHDVQFIVFLQRVHDRWPPSGWREELAALGVKAGLDIRAIWPLSNPKPKSLEDKET